MPRLVKGGKWAYGWVAVDPYGVIQLPAAARDDYGFQPGDILVALPGSRRSGGFALAAPAQLNGAMGERLLSRDNLGRAILDHEGRVALSPALNLPAGARLLAVRGSGRALGFVARGPIYEEASKHPELEYFEVQEWK